MRSRRRLAWSFVVLPLAAFAACSDATTPEEGADAATDASMDAYADVDRETATEVDGTTDTTPDHGLDADAEDADGDAVTDARADGPPLAVCGDGAVTGDEECEGADVRGETCSSVLGPGAQGVLTCRTSCTFDVSACGLPGLPVGAPWPVANASPRATRRGSCLGPRVKPTVAWSVSGSFRSGDDPLVDGAGRVYVVGSPETLYAYEPTGTLAWSFASPAAPPGTSVMWLRSGALGASGAVYASRLATVTGTVPPTVLAVSTVTGASLWTSGVLVSPTLPVVAPDGSLVVAGSSRVMAGLYEQRWLRLAAADGSMMAGTMLGTTSSSTSAFARGPTFDEVGSTYFALSLPPRARSFDAANVLRWESGAVDGNPIGAVALTEDGRLIAGVMKWGPGGTPAHEIVSLDAATGVEQWRWPSPTGSVSGIAVGRERIYVGDGATVRALSTSGVEQWSAAVAATSLTLDRAENLYVAMANDTVRALAHADGTTLWTISLSSSVNPPTAVVVGGEARLYVVGGTGALHALAP